MPDRFQFVWWGWRDWARPSWGRWTGSMALIYRWSARIGPIELRRWTDVR
jgi:hypothetical protein